jgi:hypothetical protein
MNERIKQLALQAGMVIVNDQFSTYGKFAEKFAELIVRECIDVAFDRGDNVDYLKEHFGVES